MKVTVHWQKCYDMESEVEYLGEENPGEHYFGIVRRETEGFWDTEEDECFVVVKFGLITGYEGYTSYPSYEERKEFERVLKEKNII